MTRQSLAEEYPSATDSLEIENIITAINFKTSDKSTDTALKELLEKDYNIKILVLNWKMKFVQSVTTLLHLT